MNGILKTGILAILLVFILKFALKLATTGFVSLLSLAVLIVLVGIFQEVRKS